MSEAQRFYIALGLLAGTGALTWATMDAGRIRTVVLVLLVGFALRIVLAGRRRAVDAEKVDPQQ